MADFGPEDIIVYKTNNSHILTAVLEIDARFETHQKAGEWLISNGYTVPSNNITVDPLSLDKSYGLGYPRVGLTKELDNAIRARWDKTYLKRGANVKSSYFFITKSHYNAVKDNVW